jgi:hypothetical protein
MESCIVPNIRITIIFLSPQRFQRLERLERIERLEPEGFLAAVGFFEAFLAGMNTLESDVLNPPLNRT